MYRINPIRSNIYQDTYDFKTKNQFGQLLELQIYNYDWNEFNINASYAIKFHITTKRKHGYQYLKQTGRDGLKSLLWAKECIKYFIDNKLKNKDKIVIFADDNKRLNIYKWGLKDLGFTESNIKGSKCLILRYNLITSLR
jgi:hypothetical protein